MTYQEMLEKANAFKEFREIANNKPRLIKEKEKMISRKEQRIQELENMLKEASFSLLNPKRYLARYNPVVIAEEIKQLKQEIEIELQAIDQLEEVFAVEVVDVNEIKNEINEMMKMQQKTVDSLTSKILAAQKEYFDLLQQCAQVIKSSEDVKRHVTETVNSEYRKVATRDSYLVDAYASTPLPMHNPLQIGFQEIAQMDSRIRENHIEKIVDGWGLPSHSLLNRK